MSDTVPEITLTSPYSTEKAPSLAPSPIKEGPVVDISAATKPGCGRPETPSSTSGVKGNRPTSSGWASPSRLVRRHSSNNPSSANGVVQEGGSTETVETDTQTHSSPLDPLSQHILDRTGAPLTSQTTQRSTASDGNPGRDGRARADTGRIPGAPASKQADAQGASQAQKDLKKGVKAVTFISKLMGSKKKDDGEEPDDESASSETRPEGNNAQVFTDDADNMGFYPQQSRPPAYIKVRSKYKKQSDFGHLFLAQELECKKAKLDRRSNVANKLRRKNIAEPDAETVWAMEFSKDGKYLAAAGVDGIVRVWAVLSTSEERQMHEKQESKEGEESGSGPHMGHLSAPVFRSQPVREYEGHTSTVLDLSWSKNNFLLSSSMDKTVRLWHVSRSACLCTFKHNDFVPSIRFHPKDDRFFLAGSLDSKLRLWSIPDKNVAFTATVPDMITSVAFTPDGKFAMTGCLGGLCMFFETEGLKYQSQIHVRSTRGQNAKGSKVTGIQSQYDSKGNVKVLITSNDSRIRLYNFRDKNLELKFRGNENNSSQIRASFSDDGRFIVSGSEDRKAYVWSPEPEEGEKHDKRPVEMFGAHDTITTAVCIAPVSTKLHLSRSEDPIYDLCNPPPVMLQSSNEHTESIGSSKPATETGSAQATPVEADAHFSDRVRPGPEHGKRSNHHGGHIIVTADYTGKIKVFRQDCAWKKRKMEDWDRGSVFSKRNGKMSRTGSVATLASQRSQREPRSSLSGPSDRILNWRQGVMGTPNAANGRRPSPKDSSRSISPRTSADGLVRQSSKKSRLSQPAADNMASQTIPVAPTTHERTEDWQAEPSKSSPRGAKDDNPLLIENGRSNLFWDTEEWKQRAERLKHGSSVLEQHPLTPVLSRDPGGDDGGGDASSRDSTGRDEEASDGNHLAVRPAHLTHAETYVSQLSDERSSGDEFDDAAEHPDDAMRCSVCNSTSFSATKVKGQMSLVCTDCKTPA